jgi:hypothetical protein
MQLDLITPQQTIKAPEPLKGYPCFCVTDLSKNPLYCDLPYVKGEPNFRFYCGTPLVTQDGLRIGSLFVIDQRSRTPEEGPSEAQINFLGVMAANVMQHLDNQREAEQRKRIMIMSKGLAAFTEGKHRIPSEWKKQNHADTGTSNAHERRIDLHRNSSICDWSFKSATNPEPGCGINLSGKMTPAQGNGVKVEEETRTHASVLARASNLLRESLDVAFTVFLDSTNLEGSRVVTSDHIDSPAISNGGKTQSTFKNRGPTSKSQPASVLSFSTSQSSSSSQDDVSSGQFEAMECRIVRHLLKKYPAGHLWSFDSSGHEIIVEQEEKSLYISSDLDTQTREPRAPSKEAAALMSCFHGARQILYAPIYDLQTSKSICATFAVSMQEVPAFTIEIEVAWIRSFVNNVAVEWDRVSVTTADRQKGDFLSSISHVRPMSP